VSYGALGSTHHSTHDVAVLRAIPNIDIVIPADNFEAKHAIIAASKWEKPVFIKFGKKAMPHLPGTEKFEIGKARTICEGIDIAFIACGETVAPAYEAARLLEEKGITAEVISMHTVKPLDEKAILNAAGKCKALITVEEHSIHGGLGEACASVLMQYNIALPFKIVGFPDEDTFTGSQVEIFEHYGISSEGLSDQALKLLNT
ncbi:MAG: transketolase family protein, partial [Tangfeifania sp.]